MISVKVNVDQFEVKLLEKYIAGLPDATIRRLHRIILATALTVQGDAKESILRGSPKGRLYSRGRKGKRGRKGSRTMLHQASAPGQPPASDTGQLASSILYRDNKRKKLSVSVGSVVKHGLWTEEGTTGKSAMEPRPWLKPAVDASRPQLEKRLFAVMREKT